MRNGVVVIDKEAGLSSAHVVAKVKRILKANKVGHAGTLDPDATGVLVCLVNGGTRVASIGVAGRKTYQGLIRFGVTTSTDDMAGEVLVRCRDLPLPELVLSQSRTLVGKIMQVPPRVSAIWVQGRRAHELERRGEQFTLDARPVEVHSFELEPVDRELYRYTVDCSAGTYIRSLARDLGALLGCGGAIETLRRTRSGPICVESAISVDNVTWDNVVDVSCLLPGTPRLVVPARVATALLGGKESGLREAAEIASALEISPTPDGTLLYGCEDDPETWGVLKWDDSLKLRFWANIRPQST